MSGPHLRQEGDDALGRGEPAHSLTSAAKPGIKGLKRGSVLWLTCDDLIAFSEEEQTTVFVALKIEFGSNGATVSVTKETFFWCVAFQDVALDDDGTIEAGVGLLLRSFMWEEVARTARFGTSMWELRMKRDYEDFNLFVIVHWADWNRDGIRWKKRHDLAGEKFPVLGCRMKLKTFMRRCERLGLIYRLAKVKREKGNKTRP